MTPICFALIYGIFAILFVVANLSALDITISSEIYEAVALKFTKVPFKLDPVQYIDEIQKPPDIRDWMRDVFIPTLYAEQLDETKKSSRFSKEYRMVAGFNRVLMIRLSLQRYAVSNGRSTSFNERYPSRLADNGNSINPDLQFVGVETGNTYTWETKGGYQEAGGYIVMIDPQQDKNLTLAQIENLYEDGFFDIRTTSVVLDLMIYNGNEDRFMQIGFIFSFDFAGLANRDSIGQPFNLDLYNFNDDGVKGRVTMELILVAFILWFWAMECKKVCDLGFRIYISLFSSIVDCLPLSLCTTVIIIQIILMSSEAYQDFSLENRNNLIPGDQQTFNAEEAKDIFAKLEKLGSQAKFSNRVVAISVFVVFLRAMVLMTEFSPSYSLVLRTLASAASNLFFFLIMFFIMIAGFSAFGYFTFGTGYAQMKNIDAALLELFSMLFGKNNYASLRRADPVVARIFFPLFYTVFLFIIINMFISILLTAYDLEMFKHRKEGYSNGFFQQLSRLISSWFQSATKMVPSAPFELPGVIKRISGKLRKSFFRDAPMSSLESTPDPTTTNSAEDFFKTSDFRVGELEVDREGIVTSSELTWIEKGDTILSLGGEDFALSKFEEAVKEASDLPIVVQRLQKEKLDKLPSTDSTRARCAEFVFSISYLFIFIYAVSLQARTMESNMLLQASLRPVEDATWFREKPGRIMEFETIRTVEDIYGWAITTFTEFYADCSSNCVPRINYWNRGFLDRTFLRLTMQHACFTNNTKWKKGYPVVRELEPLGPASRNCEDIYARILKYDNYVGVTNPDIKYNFTEKGNLGPYRADGGFVVIFGLTESEAIQKLDQLLADKWFSQNTVSLVFDWMTYNGNVDMFTYNEVSFSLMPTGKLEYNFKGQSFPLDLTQGGGYFREERVLVVALFSIYAIAVFLICGKLVYDILQVKRRLEKNNGRSASIFAAVESFYASTIWNVSDSISLILSVITIITFFMFFLQPFRQLFHFSCDPDKPYKIPNNDEQKYELQNIAMAIRPVKEDMYLYLRMEELNSKYATFFTVASINCFFVSIKVAKYLAMVPQVSVLSGTLSRASPLILNFSVIIFFLLFGFSVIFHVEFGVLMADFGTPPDSWITLFRFMLGEFQQLGEMIESSSLAMLYFIIYMLLFYFIFVNMYLATMISSYAHSVSQNDYAQAVKKIHHVQASARKLRQGQKIARDIIGPGMTSFFGNVEEIPRPTLSYWQEHGAVTSILHRQKWAIDDLASINENTNYENNKEDDDKFAADKRVSGAPETGVRLRIRTAECIKNLLFHRSDEEIGASKDTTLVKEKDIQIEEITTWLENRLAITGEEVWLDVLVTSLENEGLGDKLKNLLRTSNMIDSGGSGRAAQLHRDKLVTNFNQQAEQFVNILEKKAKTQYYTCLEQESLANQRVLKSQNAILNSYVGELEHLFSEVLNETRALHKQKNIIIQHLKNTLLGKA
eukprot:GEMP01002021.1.p1 GENE.GEMP01002021.1~~GEMP01002021.1.p1  ORF type:complete len:1462 (+),score=214.31 GEMP01002021.1:120-4505(+)